MWLKFQKQASEGTREFSYIYACLHMRLKRKIGPFIFGVSIGLIVGVAFFVFKLNDLFLKLKQTTPDKVTIIEQPVKNVVLKEEIKNKPERFKINLGKTVKTNYKEVDSLIATDDGITVAREELLTVKHVKPIRIGDNVTVKDSASAKPPEAENNETDLYFVEFWKTPLNSRGYRFTRNKVMLYGFADYNVLLYELDNSYYLKAYDQVYRLFPGGEFRQLEKVIDPDLLAKLN
jgi:hypothetical protein